MTLDIIIVKIVLGIKKERKNKGAHGVGEKDMGGRVLARTSKEKTVKVVVRRENGI